MKTSCNPFIRRAFLAATLTACISVPTAFAADLTWDNGAATGNWNTTDANWTGSTWSNANPDNAVFDNRNETVTLTEAITAGSLSFLAGGWQSGTHLLTLTGSPLSLASVTVNGQNGGNVDSMTDAANQKLELNNISVTASGDVSVTRGSMEVSGTTALNITGKLLATGDWSNFVMGSGTSVTVTGGVDFYNSKTATNLDFNGGTLTTASIYGNKYTNAAANRNTNVNFNGTTVVATGDNADFLQVHDSGSASNRSVAAIRTGGLVFDTAGRAVTIANVLANYTGETGTLTKNGSGTLTLSSANTYTGTTTINGGTLALAGGSAIADTGAVVLVDVSGAGLQLDSSETIGSLSGGGASGGHVNLQANTLSVGDAGSTTYAGVISGTGGLTKLGAGDLTLSGPNTYGGTTTVNAGTLTLSGARTVASGAIAVASVSGTNATLAIQNGTYALGSNSFNVGDASNATGTVNQSGGAVSFTGGAELLIGAPSGSKTSSVGVYNLSGGSISAANGGGLGVVLGVNSGAQATFNLSGSGSLTVGNSTLQIGRSNWTSSNTSNLFNQTGGTASISTLTMGGNSGGSAGVTSTLTLTGGTFSASAFSVLAAGDTNTAIINIGGTADVTLPALPTARGTSSTATFNFDGGTLRPAAASGAYISGLTNAFILDGGAKFDVASGNDITVTQTLLTDVSSTGGGLTKDGVGSLTLTGINTYTGDTTVNEGTLSLGDGTSNTSLADTAKVFIAAGASLDLNYDAGNTDTVKELWLNGVQQAIGVYGSADPSGLISGNGTLTVTSGPSSSAYDTWATSPPYNLSGPNAAFDFDYDNDGLDNGLEWILGGNPTMNDNPSILPVVTGSAAGGLTLVFNRATASLPPASSLIIDFDSNLDASWAKSVTIGAASSGPDANGVLVAVGVPSAGKVTVTIPASNAAGGKLFARLRASQP